MGSAWKNPAVDDDAFLGSMADAPTPERFEKEESLRSNSSRPRGIQDNFRYSCSVSRPGISSGLII